jgi:hypothetical protein
MVLSNKKYKNIIVAVLVLVFFILLTSVIVLFIHSKNLKASLSLANKRIAADSLSLAEHKKTDEVLLKLVKTYDCADLFLNKKENLLPFLDTIFKSYSSYKDAYQNQYIEKELHANELRKQITTLSHYKDSSESKIYFLETDITQQVSVLDSVSAELERIEFELKKIEFEMSNTSIDSLVLYSPDGTKIYFYGKTFNQNPKDFGIGFYEGRGHYIGEWKENMRNGWGRHTFKDNSVYEGNFENNVRNGFGTYYYNSGDIYKGTWKDDLMHGEGEIIKSDGKSVKGYWQKGKIARTY